MNKLEKGAYGEKIALQYLEKQGMKLIEANARFGHKEIDLIMEDGAYVVFVEVKARSSSAYGTPGEAVDHRKQTLLIRAAQVYMMRQGKDRAARFDVVEVDLQTKTIGHIKDAFSVN